MKNVVVCPSFRTVCAVLYFLFRSTWSPASRIYGTQGDGDGPVWMLGCSACYTAVLASEGIPGCTTRACLCFTSWGASCLHVCNYTAQLRCAVGDITRLLNSAVHSLLRYTIQAYFGNLLCSFSHHLPLSASSRDGCVILLVGFYLIWPA